MDATKDAQALHTAFKGLGTDEKVVIEILANRPSPHIQLVKAEYKKLFGKELAEAVKSETSGDFRDGLLALVDGPAIYQAKLLHDALSGIGTNDTVLIDIVGSRTPAELATIEVAYVALFGKPLAVAVIGDTSRDYRKLLIALLGRNRKDGHADAATVEADAEILYKAGEGRLGTDEEKFIDIFSTRSYDHLKAVFEAYQKKHKHDIITAIKKEFRGHIEDLLITIARVAMDRPTYFADQVNDAVKGLGTNEKLLLRTLFSRRDLDLKLIAAAYHRKYGQSLAGALAGDTRGNFRQLLIALVTPLL